MLKTGRAAAKRSRRHSLYTRRQRGQVLVLVVVLLPVLLGFLGLALDGGYFLLAWRAVSIAADNGARAAAVDVEIAQGSKALISYYARATSDGQAIAKKNLDPLQLNNVSISIWYNDTPFAAANDTGWTLGPPDKNTRSVKSTVEGSYTTLFLRLVGVPSINVQRLGPTTVTPPVVSLQNVLPIGLCNINRTLLPVGPWIVWQEPAGVCSNLAWGGLVNLDGTATGCGDYENWVGPPVIGPPPSVGAPVALDNNGCGGLKDKLIKHNGTTQLIVVIDTLSGNTVLGCQSVLLTTVKTPLLTTTTALPVGGLTSCGLIQTS